MTGEAVSLLGAMVLELTAIIAEACKKTPAPTGDELRAAVQACIAERVGDKDWLKQAVVASDATFTGP